MKFRIFLSRKTVVTGCQGINGKTYWFASEIASFLPERSSSISTIRYRDIIPEIWEIPHGNRHMLNSSQLKRVLKHYSSRKNPLIQTFISILNDKLALKPKEESIWSASLTEPFTTLYQARAIPYFVLCRKNTKFSFYRNKMQLVVDRKYRKLFRFICRWVPEPSMRAIKNMSRFLNS